MIPGTINGEKYPIALDESGNLQWQTIQVSQERDEIWEDWSGGIGETKRETGRGYLFARGFDATAKGTLRLSPHYQVHNNTALTTGYGYFMEDVETAGSTLTEDVAANGTTTFNASSGSFSQLVTGGNTDRVLLVGIAYEGGPGKVSGITYDGIALTRLVGASQDNDITAHIWYLIDPPTGTNTVSITMTGTFSTIAGGSVWHGVNTDTPFTDASGAKGTSTSPSVTVPTASGEHIFASLGCGQDRTVTAGTNESELWDEQRSTDTTGWGATQAGSDGGVIAPTLSDAGTPSWAIVAASMNPASTSSRSIVWWGDGPKLFRYTFDPDAGVNLEGTQTIASGVMGRPAKMNGKWYAPMASGTNARRLDDASSDSGWADAGWKADHLANYQKGIQPTLARSNSTTQNTVELNDDTSGDVGDTWTNESEAVGDSSTKITDLVEAQGELFVAKEDTLYRFGSEAESFSVIPFLDRGKIDPDNGKGLDAFGDEVVYPSKGNLWRHRLGGGSLPIGVNTIEGWRKVSAISTPRDARHVFEVHVEGYRYTLLNDGSVSHLLQRRGDSNIFHSVLTIPISKGLGVDSRNRLWIKGASTDETTRDIRVIQLAEDGSLDIQGHRGQTDKVHDIDFDERNPGRPQDQVQLRHYTVETEGFWDATTSLQLKVFLDSGVLALSVGDPITSSGVTIRNWTPGTSDTCYRFRPQLTLTTNDSYTPQKRQSDILRVIIGIRFPEIIKIVVNAEPEALEVAGISPFEAEQNLRRLQNQGVITFRRPGDYDDPVSGTDLVTDRTFQGEVEAVTNTLYKTSEGYAKGIELRVKRWITV